MNEFVIHACEQSLRFSTVEKWEDLSDKLKMQLSFNVGAMALGLNLNKEEGYQFLANVCLGEATMAEFHEHLRLLVATHKVLVDEENTKKPF